VDVPDRLAAGRRTVIDVELVESRERRLLLPVLVQVAVHVLDGVAHLGEALKDARVVAVIEAVVTTGIELSLFTSRSWSPPAAARSRSLTTSPARPRST
jgi:hypothetical protein